MSPPARYLAFSLFKGAKDVTPKAADADWPTLVTRLQTLDVRGVEPQEGKDGPGFSFASYDPPRRSNDNVVRLSALVLDIDNGAAYGDVKGGIAHLEHVAYSTHRSTTEHPKFRLVFPLTRGVSANEWPKVWQAGSALIGGHADKATKDASRFYYFHSCSKANEAASFRHHNAGAWLDPDTIINLIGAESTRTSRQRFADNDVFLAGLPDVPDPGRVCVDGERTGHLTRLAGMWIGEGNPLETVKLLASQWNERNRPPLEPAKVYSTCESIWRSHTRNRQQATTPPASLPATAGTISFGAPLQVEPLFSLLEASGARLLASPPRERRWLLKDCLPCGKVGAIVAGGGTGKSFLALQLALSVACGVPLAGHWEIGLPGSVIALFAEDDEEEIQRRLHSIVTALKAAGVLREEHMSHIATRLFVRSMIAMDNQMTAVAMNGHVSQTLYVARLIETIRGAPDLRLVIIDPASRFRSGDENSALDMTKFVQALEVVATSTGAAVLVLHHANKGSLQGGEQNQSASRGSSAFTDAVRWQLNLSSLTERDAQRFGVPDARRSLYLCASLTKQNYGPPQAPVYLERGPGGWLNKGALNALRETKRGEAMMAVLRKLLTSQTLYSAKTFEDGFGGVDGPFALSAHDLRRVLREAIDEGLLETGEGRAKKLQVTEAGRRVLDISEAAIRDLRSATTGGA